jgi:predicted AAA+ superfamily ATPase
MGLIPFYIFTITSEKLTMVSRRNPFSPGAGAQSPQLAGRDELVERALIAVDRIKAGQSARSLLLYGLRGVGKASRLTRLQNEIEAQSLIAVSMEAPENRSLPAMLVPPFAPAL